jgi:hypothetical protein
LKDPPALRIDIFWHSALPIFQHINVQMPSSSYLVFQNLYFCANLGGVLPISSAHNHWYLN